jgi:hypothetical protein
VAALGGAVMINSLSFSCVHVTAIDASGTECAYGESVNRSGITAVDIGLAVMKAVTKLMTVTNTDEDDCGNVIVRFSHDT